MPRKSHNNYFRVQGTLETFTFDEADQDSVAVALSQAKERANYHKSARVPAILVWRPSKHPDAKSLTVIGQPTVSLVN